MKTLALTFSIKERLETVLSAIIIATPIVAAIALTVYDMVQYGYHNPIASF